MFTVHCHCKCIQLLADRPPKSITYCNCSICNRLGAAWAYYAAEKVTIETRTTMGEYQWGDKVLTFHSCSQCACTTHYTARKQDGSSLLAINTRMADLSVMKDIPKRYFDGADTWQYIDQAF